MSWISETPLQIKSEVQSEVHALDLSVAALRKFGLSVGPILLVLASVAWRHWHQVPLTGFIAVFGTILIVLGGLAPRTLRGTYLTWMTVSFVIGGVMARIILLVIFSVFVIPIGLLARLVGKRFMDKGFDRAADSYWIRNVPKKKSYEQIY